jgi:HPt (histidine-containing phosphotransfer) domain-containing protein
MTTPHDLPPLSLSAQEVIDTEQFEDMRDLLEEDFADLMKTYITDSQARVASLRDALGHADNAKGFDVAHTLKGASANVGAPRLTECCAQMQEACRAHTIAQQGGLIELIAQELELVAEEIRTRLA